MSLPHKIYRRPFNPSLPEAKDIRVLVAAFSSQAKAECEATFHMLQSLSTKFEPGAFSDYRYTMHSDPPPREQKLADSQIDTSKAKPTCRPIAYNLSWEVSPCTNEDKCRILAFHEKCGVIRGEVENSPEGRNFFCRAIKRVWPNAVIKRKL